MAIIQTIRDKYAKVAGAVIVVALIGFVLMDFGKGGFSRSTVAAEVNGQEIDFIDYNKRVEQQDAMMKAQNPNAQMNEDQVAQMREEIWNQMVGETITKNLYEKLGISVTDNEVRDMFAGPIPDDQIRQAFSDPKTGQFDAARAAAQYKELEKLKDAEQKTRWENDKQNLISARMKDKIGNMVYAAANTPKAVLDLQHKLNNTLVSANVLKLPYTMVSDDKVKVTNDEIANYMQARKAIFENKFDSRSFEFVRFASLPSAADSQALFASLDTLKSGLANTNENEDFANANSDQAVQAITVNEQNLGQLPNKDEILKAPVGTVVGPYNLQGAYYLAKVFNKTLDSGSVSVRHILIMTNSQGQPVRDDATAQRLVDSVAKAHKSGADFGALALNFSDDPGSKENGGKYEFAPNQRQSLTKEFGDFAYTGKPGESKIVKVESQGYSGYHYIEILPNTPVKSVVFLFKNFTPSDATRSDINNKATAFANKAASGASAFDKEVVANGLMKEKAENVNPNSSMIQNLGSSQDLVNWSANAKVGDVSPIYLVGNNYVIAKLTAKEEKGKLNNTQAARTYVENELKRQKKAALLKKEYDSKGDINAIATASSQQVMKVDSMNFFRTSNQMLNYEPKLLGYTASKAAVNGSTSKGIAGNEGVYYIQVLNRSELPANPNRNISIERTMNSAAFKAQGYQYFIGNLTNKADIIDKRATFFKSSGN